MNNAPIKFLFYTTAYLLFTSGVGFIALMFLAITLGLEPGNNPIVPFLFMFPGFTFGGALWANSVFRSLGISKTMKEKVLVGLGYGGSFAILGYALEMIEQFLFKRNILNEPVAHLQFLASFSIAIFAVASITSVMLRAQVSIKLRLQPNLYIGILAVLTFVVVDLIFYIFGWEVGSPDFPKRSTMLVVMSLGLLLSFLVGGTIIGLWTKRDLELTKQK